MGRLSPIDHHLPIPAATLDRLRPLCLGLPETVEEAAWTGTRWRIRTKTFAHVVNIAEGWPPAYARAAAPVLAARAGPTQEPLTVLTFRTAEPEVYEHGRLGPPFFWPGWFPNIVGLALDEATDWGHVTELLVESYCVLAPKRLAALVERADG